MNSDFVDVEFIGVFQISAAEIDEKLSGAFIGDESQFTIGPKIAVEGEMEFVADDIFAFGSELLKTGIDYFGRAGFAFYA